MPEDTTYRVKVYRALKGELGDSFTKTEEEFYSALDNEDGYSQKVYTALKGELGDSFTKLEDEFLSLIKKKDDSSISSKSFSPQQLESPSIDSGVTPLVETDKPEKKEEDKSPFLKRIAAENKWGAASVNILKGIIERVGPDILDVIDGAQKHFYRSIGSVMETSGNPAIKLAGRKLTTDQDVQKTPFKKWSESATEFAEEKMPEPMTDNFLDRLGYGFGTIVPMLITLPATPEAKIGNVSTRLITNFTGRNYFSEYSKSGDMAKSLESGLEGASDAAFITLTGYAGSKFGGEVTKALSGKIPQIAPIAGSLSTAASMGVGGFSHSIAGQLASGVPFDRLDWEAAQYNAEMWVALGVPHVVQAATASYIKAPKSVVEEAIKTKASVIDIREKAIEMERDAISEKDLKAKADKAVGAYMLHETANIKAMEELMAKDPEGARKMVEKMDVGEAEKKSWLNKIDDAEVNAEYQKQLELTKDLAKAEETLKGSSQKPSETVSPKEDGKTPPKEEKSIERPETRQKTEKEEEQAEWDSVFDVPIERASSAIDELIKIEKEKPKGFGSFIEMQDARESKAVIKRYTENKSELSDQDVINDFVEALRGNPTTWYADGLKLREAAKEAAKRGMTFEYLLNKAKRIYTQGGYDSETAIGVIKGMLEPIFKGAKTSPIEKDIKQLKPKEEASQPEKVEGAKVEQPIAEDAKKDAVISEPPKKPPKPPKPPILESEMSEGGGEPRLTEDIIEGRKVERKKQLDRIKKAKRWTPSYLFWDQKESFKKRFLKAAKKAKTGNELAQRAIDRLNTQKGAKGWTEYSYTRAMKKIYGGIFKHGGLFKMIGPKTQALWSEYADLKNTIELYKSRDAAGKKALKEEYGITFEEAEKILKDIESKKPEVLKKFGLKDYDVERMNQGLEKLQEEYRKLLDEKLENGIINKAAYDKMTTDRPFYSPRKYIQWQEAIDPGGSLSGIEGLKEGSEGAKIVDIGSLLYDAMNRHDNIVLRTRAMRAIAKFSESVPNDFVRKAKYSEEFKKKLEKKKQKDKEEGIVSPYMEPEFETTPKGMESVDYLDVNAQRKRLFIEENAYKYFEVEPWSEGAKKALNIIGWVSGTKVLKAFATGYNPEFLVKNIPLDIAHILLTTDAYSPFLPWAAIQIHADMLRAAKDVLLRTGDWVDYVKEGGSMKMLSGQGKLREGRSHKWTKPAQVLQGFEDVLSYPGESSESITRIALRKKKIRDFTKEYKKQYGEEPTGEDLKEIKRDATAFARNYLDFEQGGRVIKAIDSAAPYLNAGTQVTRGALRALGNKPILFGAKVLQLASMAGGIAAWNMGVTKSRRVDRETREEMARFYENDISNEVKARNFVVITPFKYSDASGKERYLYFKFQKDNAQELVTGIAEDHVRRKVLGKDAVRYISAKRIKELSVAFESFIDVAQLPPVVRMYLGYKENKDFFYGEELWPGNDIGRDKSQEVFSSTPERYKFIGKIPLPGGYKLSPVRTQYMARQVFTEGNVVATGIGEMFDKVVGAVDDGVSVYTPDKIEKIKNIPGLRRFLKSTYPGAGKKKDDGYQEKYNWRKQFHNNKLNDMINDEADPDEIYEWLNNMVIKGDDVVKPQSVEAINEAMRLEKKYTDEVEKPAAVGWVSGLGYLSPIPRADEFFSQWIHMKPEVQNEMLKAAAESGLLTDLMLDRLEELWVEYEEEMKKMVAKESLKNEGEVGKLKDEETTEE